MHRPVWVAHSSFIEGLHTTKNTASVLIFLHAEHVLCLGAIVASVVMLNGEISIIFSSIYIGQMSLVKMPAMAVHALAPCVV